MDVGEKKGAFFFLPRSHALFVFRRLQTTFFPLFQEWQRKKKNLDDTCIERVARRGQKTSLSVCLLIFSRNVSAFLTFDGRKWSFNLGAENDLRLV